MARPSRNTDQLLIQAGRELLPQTGCSGLNIRQVAARANVNLGMFHYHFKTKDEFTRRILQEIYDDFFKTFSLETTPEYNPSERLQRALKALGRFTAENRSLIAALLRDVLNGNQEVIRFIKINAGRHFGILLGILEECKNQSLLKDIPIPTLLTFVVTGVIMPNLAVEMMEISKASRPFGHPPAALEPLILSKQAIEQRSRLAAEAIFKKTERGNHET